MTIKEAMSGETVRAIFLLTILMLCPDQSQAAEIAPGRLLITGSSTMCPLVAEMGRRFEALPPGIKVEVQCGGSGRGISDARDGKADIGMASRPLILVTKGLPEGMAKEFINFALSPAVSDLIEKYDFALYEN